MKCNASSRFLQTQAASDRFRVLFMGRDEFSCLVLQELFQAKDVWSELAIVSQPDTHVGRRGSVLSVSPLKILGESLGIPIHSIPKIRKEFKSWQLPAPFAIPSEPEAHPVPNHLLVTASFGRILTGKMLDAFQPAHRLNVHPSLLPAYRGPAPIQHSIMNDEKETGVCVIQMLKKSEGIDAGALWDCSKVDMPNDATYASLRDKLGPMGGRLLVSVLRDLLSGTATPLTQASATNVSKATPITARDALVDFTTMSASQIHARERAISHQKPLWTHTPDDRSLHLYALSVLDGAQLSNQALPDAPARMVFSKKHRLLIVRCAGDTLLGVGRVKSDGKKEIGAQEWWNGAQGTFCVGEGKKEVCLGGHA
ncbi:hypothetical protein HYPSUDRAFT_134506 [Hypholoma sublateritium FD-334 SS-4]|uniref:methionyl-tRNA formyltransferase n=1 Tax=Hypholoma sublateritium (strain FD-334 SS-4) TaxID=945553 RepID=A0A0D2PA79_HYPSF|nr:hypothetical protein HYPSUDRAFT_134506 [Hypholoma sublateritium FD-334 SS-4]